MADKFERLSTVPDQFVSDVIKEQESLYKLVLKKIDGLQRKNGVIVINSKNLKLASDIANDLTKLLSSGGYKDAVKSFIKEFDAQAEINDNLLKEELDEVIKSANDKLVLDEYKKIAAETLIGVAILDALISIPIKQTIEKAVLSKSDYTDLVQDVTILTIGDKDKLGRLERYAKQAAYDAMAQSDAAYTQSIAESNGIEFFRYAGGKVRDSREFCISRSNKYFHKKEIEAWGNLSDWQGRIDGTNSSNIFVNRGGWRCLHSFVPVSLYNVPKDVLKRNFSNGNLKINEKQKKILGV